MNKVIINGLKITTRCKFVKFTKSSKITFREDALSDTFTITFPSGALSDHISNSKVEVLHHCIELKETDFIRIYNPLIDINGTIFKVLSPYEFHFNQFIVEGILDFIVDYDYSHCNILIPDHRDADVEGYLNALKKVEFLEFISCNTCDLRNVYGLLAFRNNIRIKSDNTFTYNLKGHYERYLVRDIDCVSSFLSQLRTQVESYGMQLVKYPLDSTANVTDRLVYKITEYAKQETHKSGYNVGRDEMRHKTTIEFEGTFLNNIMFDDFRTRYQNVDLLNNFTEFYTKDRNGKDWKCSVWWSPITTDWNSDFSQDNQGNSAITCTFSCEVSYWVVYDKYYLTTHKIILDTYAAGIKDPEVNEVMYGRSEIDVTTKDENGKTDNSISTNDPMETEVDDWLKRRN